MTDHWDPDDFDFDLPDDVHLPPPLADAGLDLHLPDLDLPDLPDDVPDLPDVTDLADQVTDDTAFPPALDVDLPEPVDGFPWIDTTTLGTADPTGFLPPVEHVTADELAAYAGIDIPEGADPWTVLAASDDPATAALAKWWTQGEQ
ncbi:hypothetical protein Ait01nite_012330 [Actinoplanes italicus]|uniref:Uncharacterized protein n=1 Tax=Actinoplanes italicus TaxID=113567 RepID=A0A2T0KGV8_9ACTN|nr:hypothetical protein [Actinoplanes italicus]PRX22669.1 hypothetical protein CLV67_104197 [Actinoplanes italicus]GIE28188.1 hypothetical protein Ait01nite_012330 [Actinoplanes italicus]